MWKNKHTKKTLKNEINNLISSQEKLWQTMIEKSARIYELQELIISNNIKYDKLECDYFFLEEEYFKVSRKKNNISLIVNLLYYITLVFIWIWILELFINWILPFLFNY